MNTYEFTKCALSRRERGRKQQQKSEAGRPRPRAEGGRAGGRGATYHADLAAPEPAERVRGVVLGGDGLHLALVEGDDLPVVGEDGGAQDHGGGRRHQQREGEEQARGVGSLGSHERHGVGTLQLRNGAVLGVGGGRASGSVSASHSLLGRRSIRTDLQLC